MKTELRPLKWRRKLTLLGIVLVVLGAGLRAADINTVREWQHKIVVAQKAQQASTTPKNSADKKNTVTPLNPTAVVPRKPAVNTKGVTDSILVTNQFNAGVQNAHVWFVDQEGKKYPTDYLGYWNTDENGRVEFEYLPEGGKGDIPDGSYTVHIEKQSYTSLATPVVLTTDAAQKRNQISPHAFTLAKWGTIAAVIVDTSGKPISAYYKLIDTQGKELSTGYATDTGRIETSPVPDGVYTLRVNITYSDGSLYDPLEKLVTLVGGKDIFLGNLVLTKK